jgi:hypothetical protein
MIPLATEVGSGFAAVSGGVVLITSLLLTIIWLAYLYR